jgi:AcrR family transcriptional regulator
MNAALPPAPASAPQPTARRSDAESNRQKILGAARIALATADAEVSMAEISRQAGVGMATLYRNFPGKHELLEALYADEVNVVCRAAETVSGDSAGARFESWLRAFFEFVTSKRHVASELLQFTDHSDPVFGNSRARVTAAGQPLLASAQNAHEVRDDLVIDQILDMVHAIAVIRGDKTYLEPILASALQGLRSPRQQRTS